MFERFDGESRQVLVLAQEEARSLGHNFIGTEHLLLGTLAQGGATAQALVAQGLTLARARELVAGAIGPTTDRPAGAPPFTPRAKKVLELSLREAIRLDDDHIRTTHLVLGMIREGEGVAAQVMARAGVDRDALVRALGGEPGLGATGTEGARLRLRGVGRRSRLAAGAWRALEPISILPRLGGPRTAARGAAPCCPSCGAGLAGSTRYTRLEATGPEGEPPVEIRLAYCGSCGTALGTA